jgi:general secretion pathway protein C
MRISARFANLRFLRHAFWALVLSAAVFLFVFSWMSWLQQELTPSVRAEIEAGEKNAQRKDSTVEDRGEESLSLSEYEQNIAVDLFGPERKEEEDSGSEVSLQDIPLSEKDLGLRLMGTIIGNASNEDIAIIEDTRKNEQKMYREGDRVKNVTIKEILRDNVVIVQSNEQKILTMQYKKLRSKERRNNEQTVAAGSSQSFEREKSISRRYVMDSLQNMSKLMQDALIKPYMKNGETRGFQLDNIRSGSFYDRLGLEDKDVILQIDGKNLQSPQQMMEFTQQLSQKNRVKLTIRRNGNERTVSYQLQ